MKRLPLIAAGVGLVAVIGAVAVTSSFIGTADEAVPEADAPAQADLLVAQAQPAETEEPEDTEPETEGEASDAEPSEISEEEEPMSEETAAAETPEQSEAFRQTMHEGDIALGVCGARVSALLWFYEASVAQGRDDLKPAVTSLTESRDAIKAEAERRATDDKVDTSVRVMNAESEKMWDELNEKAAGDEKEFQKAHDTLFAGVQECLALFFERPEAETKPDADKE